MHDIEHRLGDAACPRPSTRRCSSRYARAAGPLPARDGYSMDLRIATVLRGLGFSPEDADAAVPRRSRAAGRCASRWPSCCSAGRTCCCSTSRPTTSISTRATGSRSISARIPYAVILVSHDRYFLDAVVTRITDLNLRKLTDYVGNYSKYVEQRDAMLERLRQAKREQDEEVARVKMFIDRFRYQATKAAQVQSRIKLLEKVVPIEVPPERKRIHFTFPACAKSGRTVFELKHVRKAYGASSTRLHAIVEPAHRARRPHRAGRPERRRQVDADADAVGRGSARTPARRTRRPPGRHGVLRAGRGHRASTRR